MKSPHPDWALAHKKPGSELRKINGRFYLYEVTSKWDADKKRSKKITGKILGKITKDEGFVESEKRELRRKACKAVSIGPMQVKEYGAYHLIHECFMEDIDLLKKQFPEIWQEIVVLSFIRLLHNAPIKNMAHFFGASYLSESYPLVNMGEKRVPALYRKIGTEREACVGYMKNYIRDHDHILFDGTHFVSHSKKIDSAKIGYNSKRDFDPQLNILFLFSSQLKAPVFYRLIPGNIRDVKAFKLTLEEACISKAVVIADKGFYSNDNLETMDALSLKYIVPLRRSNSAIDYSIVQKPNNDGFEGYFEYQKRFVWYHRVNNH
ncbi:MAG TPA: transposase [Balneolales bacterium]|nr:transposase [Balneolales bacterium]